MSASAHSHVAKSVKSSMVPINELKFDKKSPRFGTDVTELVASIREVGILQPVLLNKAGKLLAGKRRVAAALHLGMREIPAYRVEFDSTHEELATIDENLMQLPLNSIEFDEAMYRRKVIFEEKFPQTRAGVAGGAKSEQPSFTTETAEKLDLSRKSVELAVNRAKLATPKVKEAREQGLASSKVNEIVTLDPKLQDEVLTLVEGKSYSEVKDLVKRVKENGLEDAIRTMQSSAAAPHISTVDHGLTRLQKELTLTLEHQGKLGIPPKDKIIKKTRAVVRLMKAFMVRVKSENYKIPEVKESAAPAPAKHKPQVRVRRHSAPAAHATR